MAALITVAGTDRKVKAFVYSIEIGQITKVVRRGVPAFIGVNGLSVVVLETLATIAKFATGDMTFRKPSRFSTYTAIGEETAQSRECGRRINTRARVRSEVPLV